VGRVRILEHPRDHENICIIDVDNCPVRFDWVDGDLRRVRYHNGFPIVSPALFQEAKKHAYAAFGEIGKKKLKIKV